MSRRCELTGKRPLVGNRVSHANNKTKMRQLPNLQSKRIWVPEFDGFVRVRLSTRALRSIAKMGFVAFCRKNGVDTAPYAARASKQG
jgi:large subunit ribosomal protein L28